MVFHAIIISTHPHIQICGDDLVVAEGRLCHSGAMPHPRNDWTIRPAVPGDDVGEAPSSRGFVLVCDAAGAVGAASVLEADGRFHLMDVSVHPGWRGRGIGRALVAAVEAEVVSRGATALTLLTSDAGSARFFSRLGYEPMARLPVALRWLARAHDTAMGRTLAPHVVPRPAVSVIPLRDAPGGLEVFAQHRVGTMDFAAGAVVFPGGRVDPPDHQMRLSVPSSHADAWADTALPPPETLVAAGIREVAEECNVVLEPAEMIPWDNWVTPAGGRRRFDVAFFVTHVRPEQAAAWGNTTTEALHSVWEPVGKLLADEEAGRIRLMAPTKALLAELAGFRTAAEVLTHGPRIVAVEDDEPVRPRPPGAPAS